MFNLDLDKDGLILITDDAGYRLVLRPVGSTGELLVKILAARKMGRNKIGEMGAPFQEQVFDMEKEMARLRKAKAIAAIAAIPGISAEDIDI